MLAFLNFKQDDIGHEFRTDVAWMNMKTHELFSDRGRIIYLQLPYFTKEADACENIYERIIYVLKHMDILERMPWVAQDAVFKKLAEIAKGDDRRKYDASLRSYRDTLAVMEGQYLDGRAEGIAETARKMKGMGIAASVISQATGLTPEEIDAL